MGLSSFLRSLFGVSQKSDADILADEISAYALTESSQVSISAQQEKLEVEPNQHASFQSHVTPETQTKGEAVDVSVVVEQEQPEEVLDPIPSQMAPFMVEMIKGRSYKLCTCGQSKNHPFCDSSHEVEGCKHKPYVYKPKRSGYHSVCGCMESYDYPICDGTHDLLL